MGIIKPLGIQKVGALGLKDSGSYNDERYEVKSIKLSTKLDQGNANDPDPKKRNKTQDGMLHEKIYVFEVSEYVGKPPKDLTSIKWDISYFDIDTGQIVDESVSVRGVQLRMSLGNIYSCGRFLSIRAYIKDKKNGAVLKVWKHNRFRWLNQATFEQELEDRLVHPWKVNQSGTSLCGMACIFYLFAKENSSEYKTFCKELFQKGEATYNGYTIKPSKEILEKKTAPNGYPEKTGSMPIVDFITLAGTRNTDNPSYKGGDEEIQAINWPKLMLKLCKEFLGYAEVVGKGTDRFIKRIKYSDAEITDMISDVNQQVQDGYQLILMVDSDLIDDVTDFKSADYHWIVLEGQIIQIDAYDVNNQLTQTIDFRVYSWGTNPFEKNKGFLRKPISRNHFMNNFYGYIKVR